MTTLKNIAAAAARYANRLSITLIKSFSFLSSIIFLSLITILTAAYLADRHYTGSYFSDYMVQLLLADGFDWFFWFSSFTEAHPLVSALFACFLLAALLALKFILRSALAKRQRIPHLLSALAYLAGNLILSFAMLFLTVIIILNVMIIGYINSSITQDDLDSFHEKTDFLRNQITENRAMASLALQKIIFDLNNNTGYIADISPSEFHALCTEVNYLINLQGGPKSADEHYLRNRLNYAPPSLDDMISAIRSDDSNGWKLVPPSSAFFHMFGTDGEFNLKFISANGLFEAVYNKDGILLTELNDPVNMGTYNYADPVTSSRKHSIFDVLPYLQYGNTPDSPPPKDIDTAFLNLSRYRANKEAVNRYNAIAKSLES